MTLVTWTLLTSSWSGSKYLSLSGESELSMIFFKIFFRVCSFSGISLYPNWVFWLYGTTIPHLKNVLATTFLIRFFIFSPWTGWIIISCLEVQSLILLRIATTLVFWNGSLCFNFSTDKCLYQRIGYWSAFEQTVFFYQRAANTFSATGVIVQPLDSVLDPTKAGIFSVSSRK